MGNKSNMPGFEDNYEKIVDRYSQKYSNLHAHETKYFELRKKLS